MARSLRMENSWAFGSAEVGLFNESTKDSTLILEKIQKFEEGEP